MIVRIMFDNFLRQVESGDNFIVILIVNIYNFYEFYKS